MSGNTFIYYIMTMNLIKCELRRERLLDKTQVNGGDLDPRVMSAYILQCQAEAQEVTIARAIELKHSPSLISALANETSKMFLSAASAIKALEPNKFGKWMSYFQLKSAFYESYVIEMHFYK